MRKNITPKGIRIPVASVKGRCPEPLDDGGLRSKRYDIVILIGFEPIIQTQSQSLLKFKNVYCDCIIQLLFCLI
jgi:hypothetical protein